MPKEDLLMRYFNEFAKFLAILVGLRKQGKTQLALDKMGMFFNEQLHLPLTTILDLQDEKLPGTLIQKGLGIVNLNMIGDLLYEFALVQKEKKLFVEYKNALTKAALLLQYVVDHSEVFSIPRMEKLKEIRNRITGLRMET